MVDVNAVTKGVKMDLKALKAAIAKINAVNGSRGTVYRPTEIAATTHMTASTARS